jgi:hypothetical protein
LSNYGMDPNRLRALLAAPVACLFLIRALYNLAAQRERPLLC